MVKSLGIVVGVDGSEHAQKALAWALEEARLRHVPVTAVHGWDYHTPYGRNMAAYVGLDTLEAEVRRMVADAVDPWREKYQDVPLHTRLIGVSGAAALVEASKEADLVVVGSRGHGGFLGLLLGSVSGAVVHHAHCPVVVVRDGR